MMHTKAVFLLFALMLMAPGAAKPELQPPGPVEVFATFHAAGLRLSVSGDSERRARAVPEFRRRGERAWREGLPLARIDQRRFAGSLFGLEPGTAYEARLRLELAADAARQPEPAFFETPSDRFPTGSGRLWNVRSDGRGDGSPAQPFGSIQQAVDRAAAGDLILVEPGIYREAVEIRERGGTSDACITIRGKAGARLWGTLAGLETSGGAGRWRPEGDGVFSAPVAAGAGEVGYVASGESRLFRWASLDELRRGAAGVRGGYFWDAQTRRVYVALPDGADPHGAEMHVAVRPFGLRFVRSSYWIVEGLDLGYFGSPDRRGGGDGIILEDSSHVIVRRNRIHHANHGISTSGATSSRILIEDNDIYDTSIVSWPWNRVKATEAEGSGVRLRGGAGQVVRRNRISGTFNGVAASTWGALMDETRNNDLDIYENEFNDIGDDPIEPEGTCINVRIWGNRMRNTLTGVSLAPITLGPTYVLRNTSLDHGLTAVKLNVGADNPGWKYVLHNTFVTRLRERPQLDGTRTPEGVPGMALWLHRRMAGAPVRAAADAAGFGWGNGVFFNNLVYATARALEAASVKGSVTFDYNNLWNAGFPELARIMGAVYPNLAALRAAGHESHGISAEPQFIDLAAGDLRLRSGSTEIDRGKRLPNINDGFNGRAPDIGAFEFLAPTRGSN